MRMGDIFSFFFGLPGDFNFSFQLSENDFVLNCWSQQHACTYISVAYYLRRMHLWLNMMEQIDSRICISSIFGPFLCFKSSCSCSSLTLAAWFSWASLCGIATFFFLFVIVTWRWILFRLSAPRWMKVTVSPTNLPTYGDELCKLCRGI